MSPVGVMPSLFRSRVGAAGYLSLRHSLGQTKTPVTEMSFSGDYKLEGLHTLIKLGLCYQVTIQQPL